MKRLSSLFAAAVALAWFAPAHAVPTFCTGTIFTVASGGFIAGNLLAGTDNCVQASDKFFGNFEVGGVITGGGSAGWLFTSATGPADVTIGFQGLVGANSVGSISYQVEIDPLTSNGALISALEKDFTFNSTGIGSTATLTGTVTPAPSSFTGGDVANAFQCTRTATTSTCPQFGFFDPTVNALTIDQTITTGPNTNVTAITDTVFQVVPEPGSLAILGTGLIALWGFAHRRNRRHMNDGAAAFPT